MTLSLLHTALIHCVEVRPSLPPTRFSIFFPDLVAHPPTPPTVLLLLHNHLLHPQTPGRKVTMTRPVTTIRVSTRIAIIIIRVSFSLFLSCIHGPGGFLFAAVDALELISTILSFDTKKHVHLKKGCVCACVCVNEAWRKLSPMLIAPCGWVGG